MVDATRIWWCSKERGPRFAHDCRQHAPPYECGWRVLVNPYNLVEVSVVDREKVFDPSPTTLGLDWGRYWLFRKPPEVD